MKKGITLIELLIVIAIFLIFFGVSFLGIPRYYNYYHFSKEFNELIDDFHYAKQMSITEQIHHAVLFNYIENGYSVVKYIGDSTEIVKSKNFSYGINIVDIDNYEEAKFTFFGAIFRSGKIKLTNGFDERIINIKPSGFVYVERTNIN